MFIGPNRGVAGATMLKFQAAEEDLSAQMTEGRRVLQHRDQHSKDDMAASNRSQQSIIMR